MILQEEIFEKAHYDIIVAGGGVGGAAAAVQAAREGKRVLLVEKSQKLGGLATLGLSISLSRCATDGESR